MVSKKATRSGLVPHAHNRDIIKAAVNEIILTCNKYLSKSTKKLNLLDMGSGNGDYSNELSKHFNKVVGVEPFKKGYENAVRNYKRKNLSFINSTIENYPKKSKFDVVVSLTIFEHLSNPKKAFKKTFSLLKKSGIIYLTAPNKYWIFEQHYGLPFLSWLPLPLANFYLRAFRDEGSYKDSSYSRGYYGMKKFFNQFKCEYEFLTPFDPDGKYFGCNSKKPTNSLVRKLGIKLIKLNPFFWSLSKGFIMVIKKK